MIRFDKEEQYDYQDVLLKPCYSTLESRKDVCLTKHYMDKLGNTMARGIPIMNANMATVGNFAVARAMLEDGMFATIHKHYQPAEIVDFVKSLSIDQASRLFITIGLRDEFMDIHKLVEVRETLKADGFHPGNICIDVPNAYLQVVIDLVKRTKDRYPGAIIMAGNVCDWDGTLQLCHAGASIVKAGVGCGVACRTRFATGVGRPQFSTIVECVAAAQTYNAYVCADGGITYPGDVAKALAAGAEFVMLGSFYAGTDEAEGDIYMQNGEKSKIYYGMASETAQKKFYGGVADYKTSEGALLTVPYTGHVHDQNLKICGGLRSACTYLGASNLEELAKNATFYKVRRQHTIKGDN